MLCFLNCNIHKFLDNRNGRPRSVVDAAEAPILEGSLTGSGLQVKVTHEYDANGNLVKDATRGIDSIRYNVLNLPERIYFSNGYRLDYVYRADGVKLRETRRRPTFSIGAGSAGVITETTDYVGSYELEGGIPRRLNLPGGYMTIADTVYHHYIPDYQGNILAVVNTRTRQLEQRTDYYPYGMPHGSATGAGVNRRKYSGKELITFAGYDAMDYHARWRPTALPLFTTPDPMAEKRQNISIYAYCSGDPINKVDLDGCDEWEISENGHVVRHVETKAHDALFVLDRDGSRAEGKSISFEYGTVKSFHSDLNWEGENFNVIKMRGDKQSTAAFEFLASNTKVEWGHTGTREEGAKGLNFLTTSMESTAEGGGYSIIKHQLLNGCKLRFYNHSHPDDVIFPSGMDQNSNGDIAFAKWLKEKCKLNIALKIYLPSYGEYVPYSADSVASDFDIYGDFLMYLNEFKVTYEK